MGSTRALACPDRRPRRSDEGVPQSLTGEQWTRSPVLRGRGTAHVRRVRSPFLLIMSHALASVAAALLLVTSSGAPALSTIIAPPESFFMLVRERDREV